MFEKILDFLRTLTWKRYGISTIAVITGIVGYTLFENRQKVYDKMQPQLYAEDYPLTAPGPVGKKILAELASKYPEIAIITIVDADPVRNQRIPVFRLFLDKDLEDIVKRVVGESTDKGNGPLFSSDEESNKQVIAIMNGEFACTPGMIGEFVKLFPESKSIVKHSCRIPLPPAFNRATGWISLHFREWPVGRGYDSIKYDALSASLAYFNAEIASKFDTKNAQTGSLPILPMQR